MWWDNSSSPFTIFSLISEEKNQGYSNVNTRFQLKSDSHKRNVKSRLAIRVPLKLECRKISFASTTGSVFQGHVRTVGLGIWPIALNHLIVHRPYKNKKAGKIDRTEVRVFNFPLKHAISTGAHSPANLNQTFDSEHTHSQHLSPGNSWKAKIRQHLNTSLRFVRLSYQYRLLKQINYGIYVAWQPLHEYINLSVSYQGRRPSQTFHDEHEFISTVVISRPVTLKHVLRWIWTRHSYHHSFISRVCLPKEAHHAPPAHVILS